MASELRAGVRGLAILRRNSNRARLAMLFLLETPFRRYSDVKRFLNDLKVNQTPDKNGREFR